MQTPINSAAQQIVAAQSIISDINQQILELQRALSRQQGIIDVLLPLAAWDIADEDEADGEPDA